MFKVHIGQINPTPCDWVGNLNQIHEGIIRAAQERAHMSIFPELCIPGYLVQDKMRDPKFVERNLQSLQDIVEFSRAVGPGKPYIVVGYIDYNHKGDGKPFRNMAAVIHDGILIGTYQKCLLPYYDVFDEGRYFAPGSQPFVFEAYWSKWGILICEDWSWNDKGQDDYVHTDNPVQKYRDLGVQNLITINASPFEIGKSAQRISQAKKICGNGIFIFANQRGGMDELLFSGDSFIILSNGVHHLCKAETHSVVECGDRSQYLTDNRESLDTLYDALVLSLRDYVCKSGFEEVVVGSSGGIDSALVLMIACDAIGPENVHAVRMPSKISSDHSLSDAEELHKKLGCHDYIVPIDHQSALECIKKHVHLKRPRNPIADQNIQSRLRANILMDLSNAYGWLLLATGNKTELATGYCTLGGDMMGGFAPIKDLYKGQIYQIAFRWGKDKIPPNIIQKKPSAELMPDQFDEDDLLAYPILDAIAKSYVEHNICTFREFIYWADEVQENQKNINITTNTTKKTKKNHFLIWYTNGLNPLLPKKNTIALLPG